MNRSGALAIDASGLAKTFGETHAVDGVDLAVARGSVHGILGPNGAGKTTAIRLLATLLRPDAGSACVLGYDVVREPEEVRRRISLTGQFASLDDDLTGSENLMLLGRLLGLSRLSARERAVELLQACGLGEAGHRQVKGYSGGMRRRLDIAASIIVTPELLFLDEPTTGLDPRSRNQVWSLIRSLAEQGTTVLLTTQYLDEAGQLADHISVIDRGRVIASGTPDELRASIGAGTVRVRLRDPGQRDVAERLLTQALSVPISRQTDPASLAGRVSDARRVELALTLLSQEGVDVTEFAFGQASLDEVFLALTGRAAPHARDDEEDGGKK